MARDVEDQALGLGLFGRLPAGEVEGLPGQHQMPGGADRQELGDALHQGQDQDVQERQIGFPMRRPETGGVGAL